MVNFPIHSISFDRILEYNPNEILFLGKTTEGRYIESILDYKGGITYIYREGVTKEPRCETSSWDLEKVANNYGT